MLVISLNQQFIIKTSMGRGERVVTVTVFIRLRVQPQITTHPIGRKS